MIKSLDLFLILKVQKNLRTLTTSEKFNQTHAVCQTHSENQFSLTGVYKEKINVSTRESKWHWDRLLKIKLKQG